MSTMQSDSTPRIDDLTSVVAFTLGATVALLLPGVPWVVEWAFGLPLLLFIPGYAIVSALFPTAPTQSKSTTQSNEPPGWATRVAIALLSSVLTAAVVGTGLSVAGFLTLAPVILALVVVTYGAVWVAWKRRRQVASNRRADLLSHITSHTTRSHLGLTANQALTLGLAVLLLGAGTVAAGMMAPASPSYSEAALLSTDNGTAIGTNGTVRFDPGERNSVTLRVENHEGATVTYGVVGLLQDVAPNGTVVSTRVLDRGQIPVSDGQMLESERTITPSRTEHRARLQYLVYLGPIPENPTPQNAALSLRIWIEYDGGAGT